MIIYVLYVTYSQMITIIFSRKFAAELVKDGVPIIINNVFEI